MSEIPAAAVEAAAMALCDDENPPECVLNPGCTCVGDAHRMLAAAAPLIRQATADEIADGLERLADDFEDIGQDALIRGARYARRVGGGGGGGGGGGHEVA